MITLLGTCGGFLIFSFPHSSKHFKGILGAGKLLKQKSMSRSQELRQQESHWPSINYIAFCFCPCFYFFLPQRSNKPVFWRNRLLAFRVMPIFFSTTYSRLITENPLTSIICRVWSRTIRHQRIPSHHYHRLPQDPGMRGGKGLQNFIPHQLAHIGGGIAMEPLDWVHCRAYWQSLPYPQTISNIQTTLNGMIHIGYTKKNKKNTPTKIQRMSIKASSQHFSHLSRPYDFLVAIALWDAHDHSGHQTYLGSRWSSPGAIQ